MPGSRSSAGRLDFMLQVCTHAPGHKHQRPQHDTVLSACSFKPVGSGPACCRVLPGQHEHSCCTCSEPATPADRQRGEPLAQRPEQPLCLLGQPGHGALHPARSARPGRARRHACAASRRQQHHLSPWPCLGPWQTWLFTWPAQTPRCASCAPCMAWTCETARPCCHRKAAAAPEPSAQALPGTSVTQTENLNLESRATVAWLGVSSAGLDVYNVP